MLTQLFDLMMTASAIGLIASVAGLGVVVLPWRAAEAQRASDALDTAARLPLALLGSSATAPVAPVRARVPVS